MASSSDEKNPQPAELEHIIGFNSNRCGSILCHPTETSLWVHFIGSNIVIADLTDPYAMKILA